ncbi:MAG: hypothetical protein FJW36_01380 [Acidobacteria bacterium]|nr:hypothetical protein [Acidobacteriota bacterium]
MPSNVNSFPALDNGMLAQLPVSLLIDDLSRTTRFPDGSLLGAAAESRLRYRWTLRYDNLGDAEWQRMVAFIDATGRGAESFAFPDPIGNLLAQSANLESSPWVASPGLVVDTISDLDQANAFILTNSAPLPLTLTQTVALDGPFKTCFSVMAKWAGGASFSLSLSDGTNSNQNSATANEWSRFAVVLSPADAPSRLCSITVPANTQVIVASPQLEIAAAPGAHLATGLQSSLFPAAWLADQSYDSQSNAPGAHSITLRIESLRNR